MKMLAKIIGSTFGCGYSPIAPGTVGSLAAITVLWFLPLLSPITLIIAAIVFFAIGVWASFTCEKDWGHDAGRICWDEVVGMMITVIAIPKHWIVYLAAFLVFRFFDIVKPFPVNRSQQLPHGWGVMIDDVLAGIYANLALQLAVHFIFNPMSH